MTTVITNVARGLIRGGIAIALVNVVGDGVERVVKEYKDYKEFKEYKKVKANK